MELKDFKIRSKDYTSGERTLRVIGEIIAAFIFILFMILIIFSFINEQFINVFIYMFLLFIFMLPYEIFEHYLKNKIRARKIKNYYASINLGKKEELKNIIIGMAETTGQVDLKQLAKKLKLSTENLRLLIFSLVGGNLLSGKIKGSKFILAEKKKIEEKKEILIQFPDKQAKEEKLFCQYCQKPLESEMIVCPNCGTQLEKTEPTSSFQSEEDLKNLPDEILKHYEEYRWADKRIPHNTKSIWKQKIPSLTLEGIEKLIAGFRKCKEMIDSDMKYYMETQIPGDDANYSWLKAREPYDQWLKYLHQIKSTKR